MITSLEEPTTTSTVAPESPATFAFRPFQTEDFTRAAMHPGAIVALDPGGGKTLGIYTIPFMRGSRRTLIVAPASLIEQIQDEGEEKLGIRPIFIRNQDDAYALMRSGELPFPGTPAEPPTDGTEDPAFFITDYHALGYNGADEVAPKETDEDELDSGRPAPKLDCAHHIPEPYRTNIGKTYNGIKCVGSPSLSTILQDAFDCACCDEGVRIKGGEETHIARGVLQINAASRYVFTGTPIKNRLTDIFFLISWVCGYSTEPSARWPFGNTPADQADFARNHLVIECNDSAYQRTGRRISKQTAKICNVHRLWKLLGPIVVRRRKDDMGKLVRKIFKPLHFAPGTEQLKTYTWHAQNRPKKKTPLASMGAQLQALRTAACCPWSGNLYGPSSPEVMTPKIAGILQLTADLMEKDEQLVVFSPFQQFATELSHLYAAAGVPHAILDGRTSPKKRGSTAKRFKSRELPVIICGIESMGEGHSFHMASNLVLPSLTWAWDKNAQAIDRVHRLISKKDVTIYIMSTKGTIDERLLSLFQEKGDSNDLALDGRLFEHEREEVSIADILRDTLEDFDPNNKSIPEDEVRRNYILTLKPRLAIAAQQWQTTHQAPEETPTNKKQPAKRTPRKTPIKSTPVKPLHTRPSTPVKPQRITDPNLIANLLADAFI